MLPHKHCVLQVFVDRSKSSSWYRTTCSWNTAHIWLRSVFIHFSFWYLCTFSFLRESRNKHRFNTNDEHCVTHEHVAVLAVLPVYHHTVQLFFNIPDPLLLLQLLIVYISVDLCLLLCFPSATIRVVPEAFCFWAVHACIRDHRRNLVGISLNSLVTWLDA